MSSIPPSRNPAIASWKIMLGITLVTVILLFLTVSFHFLSLGNEFSYQLPWVTWLNTFILLLSSLSIHWGQRGYSEREHIGQALTGVAGAAMFGLIFIIGQGVFFLQLSQQGVGFVGAPSGSAIYLMAALHAFHMLAGFITFALLYRNLRKKPLAEKTRNLLSGGAFFWHFLGLLWFYLVTLMAIMQ